MSGAFKTSKADESLIEKIDSTKKIFMKSNFYSQTMQHYR